MNEECLKNDHEKYVLTQSIALLSRLGTKKRGRRRKKKGGKKKVTVGDKIYITNNNKKITEKKIKIAITHQASDDATVVRKHWYCLLTV